MDAKTLLEQNNSATVSDLVAHGVSRHKARHDFEDLVKSGAALKITEGKKVSYSRLITGSDAVRAAMDALPAGLTALGVPEAAAPVLPFLLARKALSVKVVARRAGLPIAVTRQALEAAKGCGLAVKPFHRSKRYRLAS